MRSHVTFKTHRFNQTEVQPHFINPCCFGEDCIFWLIAELRERGWADLTDPWQEDWGWQTSGQRDERRYLLGVGLIPERLRGRGELVVLPRLAPALHQVLRAALDISDVRWHFEDVFHRGGSDGAVDPSVPRSAGETG